MKKNFKTIMTVLLCLAMLTALAACGGNKADDELIKWVSADGKTWADAQTKFDTDYAQAVANNDQNAAVEALNTIIAAAGNAKTSLEKIDRDKLSDANKGSYDQNLNGITESLKNYETSLAQYQGATGGEEVPEDGGEEVPAEE